MVNLRFLDAAIHQLQPYQTEELDTIATDGRHLFYNSWHLLNSYQKQKETITRDVLHVIFHCLFQHLFVNKLIHQACWDLACDIAVENAINDLEIPSLKTNRQSQQARTLTELKSSLKVMTAEKIYRYYLDQNLSVPTLNAIRDNFLADDHRIWYLTPQNESRSEDNQESEGELGYDSTKSDPNQEGQLRSGDFKSSQELIDYWKQISERAQVDIETTSIKWGNIRGGLHQELKRLNRERYNYASFLKRFSVLGEAMQVNDDEFDLIFYTYGLKLYKNLPLIEPLEYKEVKRIKEFVIAIDTSSSVSGPIVQTFVQKTYNILKQTESFFTKINIHIIQCDTDIQEDIKITSAEELESYIKTMQIRGFGGTDFRPVFQYVDQLIENREFENLKGLIYFTDGYGTYPSKKTNYETAFVFLEDDYQELPEVPPWAIKLVLSTDDISEERIIR